MVLVDFGIGRAVECLNLCGFCIAEEKAYRHPGAWKPGCRCY
jgi:hypothetical protein